MYGDPIETLVQAKEAGLRARSALQTALNSAHNRNYGNAVEWIEEAMKELPAAYDQGVIWCSTQDD